MQRKFGTVYQVKKVCAPHHCTKTAARSFSPVVFTKPSAPRGSIYASPKRSKKTCGLHCACMPGSSRAWMETEAKAAGQAPVLSVEDAASGKGPEQVDAADVTTGAALFDLSSYTGGAPLIPMGDGGAGVGGPSTGPPTDGMFDQELMGKHSDADEKKMGRPSHPAWQFFVRGEKRNRFHHNAYCRFCTENGENPVAVRGVSGNMIRHLQKCIYCPSEVVTQLKLLCAQKDAANFNKRHQSQSRSVDMLLQETSPAPRKRHGPAVKTKGTGLACSCGILLCVELELWLPRRMVHRTRREWTISCHCRYLCYLPR
ncbi:Zinc finger, BED-type predicted [Phytophthora cinnamomi]|uniref:Zinc finger, BED-type predicted n=1 Tax=Phytophthora cinnamomi TaxID=4785 RepID=UPI00355A8112|nr:Zinc finger, BED-type predicted [Phytophthora cinnamomi]